MVRKRLDPGELNASRVSLVLPRTDFRTLNVHSHMYDCLLRLATTPSVMGQKDAAIVTLDRISPISWIAHKSVGNENRHSRHASHRKCEDAI